MHLYLGISGWLPKRLALDSLWNRTGNIRGGAGHNLALDFINELDNKDFKGTYIHTNDFM